jgi:glutaredoxin
MRLVVLTRRRGESLADRWVAIASIAVLLLLNIGTSDAFVSPVPSTLTTGSSSRTVSSLLVLKSSSKEEGTVFESVSADLQRRWEIGKESNDKPNSNFKQVMADVLAGDYNATPIQEQIESDIQSASVVMYIWEASPSCKEAIKAFETILGVDSLSQASTDTVRIIRLDDPWSEGNPIRAQLGYKVGRTSVPCIFLDGNYVGGFDAGMGADAPGIQTMAFQGTLRPALEAAGLTLPS